MKNLRVACLYRVSTKGQVVEDDIPMQKGACRNFATEKRWHIIDEKLEKGVSGFKVSAENRDEIQELKKDAEDKKFDILLVFMFDRLDRREYEMPLVMKWFSENGIEVWSV
ncbi:MAG: recombinase family protein [Oscillospiraceae bacterium]|nr:recombinase family protein [Oscillospiraceae bacterium]